MAIAPIDTSKESIIGSLRGVVLKYVKQQVLAELAKAAPWLFTRWLIWLTNPALEVLLNFFLGYILDRTILGLSLIWISIDLAYEVNTAEDATKKLRDILDHPEKYTAEQIKQVEENFDARAIDLIRLGLRDIG